MSIMINSSIQPIKKTNIHFNSIKTIPKGIKIEGRVDDMNGIVCSFIGNKSVSDYLLKSLIGHIADSCDGISAININNVIYLTHTYLNSDNCDEIDIFYTKSLIKQILIKSAHILFYIIDHVADKSDYDELRKIRTQILIESEKIPIIFVIHQVSNSTTKESLNKIIEENKTYCETESSNLFGFVTNSGKITTNHIFLEFNNSQVIEYIRNKIKGSEVKPNTFSLINTTKLEILNTVPKYILDHNNFDLETEYINDTLYLISKNESRNIMFDDIIYYVNSGNMIPENSELKYKISIFNTKIILSISVNEYIKENIIIRMYYNSFREQILIIEAVNNIDRRFCILKFLRKSQIVPINNFSDFLFRSENKLENKKLELHFNRI